MNLLLWLISSAAFALPPLPLAPVDANHPGSKIYGYKFSEKTQTCGPRDVTVFLPEVKSTGEKFPVVVYGHGQALGLDSYHGTFAHLAGKGIAVIFPSFDTGFFDQDWTRMGRDFVAIADCVLKANATTLASDQVLFSGHSKGAYVASVAAGLTEKESLAVHPRTLMLFDSAGVDTASIGFVSKSTSTIVIYADRDKTVDRGISETTYNSVSSSVKRFIFVKSYDGQTSTKLAADHFFPLTKGSFFGGGSESALHYYGAWKWLAAGANDLRNGATFSDPYLYGIEAADKGVAGFTDDVR